MTWLARLAFSFLILAGLLLYQVYRESAAGTPPLWRVALYCVGAGVSVGLAARGFRERHRSAHGTPPDDPSDA